MSETTLKLATCAQHGNYNSHPYFGDRWSGCPVCAQKFENKLLISAAEEKEAREARILAVKLEHSGIPQMFRGCTLMNYVASSDATTRARQVALLKDAAAFINDFGNNLHQSHFAFFLGNIGTGKTHVACSIGIELIKAGYSVKYTTIDDYFIKIRDSYRSQNVSELAIRDEYAAYDFLIIDELGVQSCSESEDKLTLSLLDKRYRELKSTLFISNKDKTELESILGERLISRIRQGGALMKYFTWEDYRVSKR